MSKWGYRLAILFLAMGTLASPGCDWIHYLFMNSIPFKGNPKRNPDVYVYLGVDGLSYFSVIDAMKKGAFREPSWKLAKFITMFPGTSDASWTRILHTPKMEGFEIEYYNPNEDVLHNKGLLGLSKHIMPTFYEGLSFEYDYLKAFDYRANGYTHGVEAYRDTYVSLGDTLDNLFTQLGGRSETRTTFSAYILEYDVLGHMQSAEDVSRRLVLLSKRIEEFRKNHPERRFHFTLFSDHGMDFIRVQKDRLIEFDKELREVGVTPVETLRDQNPRGAKPYAIPIMHTRVTYMALHTHPDLAMEVAARTSRIPSVDIAVSRIKVPPVAMKWPDPIQWFALWTEGKIAAYFGFDPHSNQYFLPDGQNWARLGMEALLGRPAQPEAPEGYSVYKDRELFDLTKDGTYPDILFRVRTSLSAVGCQFPPEVMASMRPTYASLGYQPAGTEDIASSGFHGSLEKLGSLGTLLTDERDLPDAVRSDNFLELFPRMKDHMRSLGVQVIEGEAQASLQY